MSVKNFAETTITELVKELPIEIEAGTPLLIHGPVGCGKTSAIRTFAEENDFDFIPYVLSNISEPSDINGLPCFVDTPNGRVTSIALNEVFPREGCRPTIILLDEFYSAAPEIQAAVTTLLLEKRVGVHKLPDNVYVMAATNDSEHASFTAAEDNAAINTRCAHYMIRPDAKEFIGIASKLEMHPAIISWISIQPECVSDELALNQEHTIFSNYRTLEAVSKYLYSVEKHKGKEATLSSAAKRGVTARIGQAAQSKFYFVLEQILTLHPLEEYIQAYNKDPKSVRDIAPTTMASLYGLAYSLINQANTTKTYRNAVGVMTECCSIEDALSRKEIFSMFIMQVVKKLSSNKKVLRELLKTPEFDGALVETIDITNWIDE